MLVSVTNIILLCYELKFWKNNSNKKTLHILTYHGRRLFPSSQIKAEHSHTAPCQNNLESWLSKQHCYVVCRLFPFVQKVTWHAGNHHSATHDVWALHSVHSERENPRMHSKRRKKQTKRDTTIQTYTHRETEKNREREKVRYINNFVRIFVFTKLCHDNVGSVTMIVLTHLLLCCSTLRRF